MEIVLLVWQVTAPFASVIKVSVDAQGSQVFGLELELSSAIDSQLSTHRLEATNFEQEL
jgi:hypothetical protein